MATGELGIPPLAHATRLLAACGLLVTLTALPARAQAQPVCISIKATVESVDDPDNVLDGTIIPGQVITGSYVYDLTTPDNNADPVVGDYRHNSAPYGISINAAPLLFRTDPANVDFLVEIRNDYATLSGSLLDNYVFHSYNNVPLAPSLFVEFISWQLDDPTATAVSSDALPPGPPILADWQSIIGLAIVGGNAPAPPGDMYFIRAHVTSATACSYPPSSCPPPSPNSTTHLYAFEGTADGINGAWCLREPGCFEVKDLNVPGAMSMVDLTNNIVMSVNNQGCPGLQAQVLGPASSGQFMITADTCGGTLEFRVGTGGANSCDALSLVVLPNNIIGPGQYNPKVNEVPLASVIPTVSEWGLLILAMLLLCAGTIRIGRRPPIPASRKG